MTDSPDWRLYGTVGCHLCEQALEQLALVVGWQRVRSAVEQIDIADDDALLTAYQTRIPVLVSVPGGESLDWPFDAAGLRRWLDTLETGQ